MSENFLHESQINFNIGQNFDRDLYLELFANEEYDVEKFEIAPEVPGEITITIVARKENIDDILFKISELDPEMGELDFFTELVLDDAEVHEEI